MSDRVSYTKKTWTNHVVQYPRRYEETTQDGFIKHAPKFGTIIQQGTPVKAEYMNNIEQGVKDCADAINDMDQTLNGKQDELTFDSTPTADSANPVTSGGVKAALDGKQDSLTFDSTPTTNSENPVTSGGVKAALDQKQGTLTFDDSPTAGSNNPVKSGGIKTALDGKQGTLTFDDAPTANSNNPVKSKGIKTALDGKQNTLTFDDTPTANSDNPVKSGGIRAALDSLQSSTETALENKVKSFTATIPATGWTSQSSGAYYTISLTVNGILSTDTPDIGIVQTGTWSDDEDIRDAWACVTRITASANDQLTITASEVPSVAIPIQVRCIR